MATPVASEIVQAQITSIQEYATASFAAAEAAMASLSSLPYTQVTGATIEVDQFEPYPFQLPAPPAEMATTQPPAPIDVHVPNFPTAPNLTIPNAPTLKEIAGVDKPDYLTPSPMANINAPVLADITMPDVPVVDFSDYEVTLPDPLVLTPPASYFAIDTINEDPVIGDIRSRLRDNIRYGGTGLTAAIETAIWQRDLERNNQQIEDATDKVTSMWAKKGFRLPDGMLANSLSDIQKEYMNRMIDRSREISIKQAELEQTNIFKSMELGLNLGLKLYELEIKYQELVLNVQEATAKYAYEYIDAQVKVHALTIEVFKAELQWQESRMKREELKVNIYRAQVEGALALAGLNELQVKIYTARIHTELEKYKGVIDTNKSIAEMFSSEVQAVLALAQVEEMKMKAYSEAIRALALRVEIYKAEVEGAVAHVSAQKMLIDANIAQVSAWAKGVDATIATYNGRVEAYKAEGQLGIATAELGSTITNQIIQSQIEKAKINVSLADVVARSIAQAAATQMEAEKGVASAAASLAAGAMAAMSARASLEYGESMRVTETS